MKLTFQATARVTYSALPRWFSKLKTKSGERERHIRDFLSGEWGTQCCLSIAGDSFLGPLSREVDNLRHDVCKELTQEYFT